MSTNKTPNYKLHAWEKSDKFLMDEMNENFAKLDEKLKAEADGLNTAKADAATVTGLDTTVKGLQTTVNAKVPLAGGTMTGLLTLSGDPTAVKHAATKQYVDNQLKALGKVVAGTYTGNGKASQTITLAGTVLAVLIEVRDGRRSQMGNSYIQGGMALPSFPLDTGAVKISGKTFIVMGESENQYWTMNTADKTFYYIALLQQ